MDDDLLILETLGDQIAQGYQIHTTIRRYGIDPTSQLVLGRIGLLSSVALEAFGWYGPKDAQTQIALEALVADTKAKVSAWSAKLLSIFSERWQSYLETSTQIHGALVEKIGRLTKSKLGDPGEADKFVKTHPLRTVVAAVEAALVVLAILGFATMGLGSLLKATSRLPFLKSLTQKIGAIAWPFGKISAVLSSKTGKITLGVAAVSGAGVMALKDTGYTKQAVTKLGEKVHSSIEHFGHSWPAMKDKTIAVAKGVGVTAKASAIGASAGFKGGYKAVEQSPRLNPSATRGGEWSMATGAAGTVVGAAGAAIGAVVPVIGAVCYVLFQLFRKIVLASWHLVSSTFSGLQAPKDDSKAFV